VDNHFIHCNIDTDVIIAEEVPGGSKQKPEELFNIIENFCMGRRRLEIFGSDESMRPGWLTVGDKLTCSTYEPKEYLSYFQDGNLVGHHQGKFSGSTGSSSFRNRIASSKVTYSQRSVGNGPESHAESCWRKTIDIKITTLHCIFAWPFGMKFKISYRYRSS
jgi:MT-A70